MSETEQIPRTSLTWVMLAQLVILLPHISHAPIWLWAIWLGVMLWRWEIFRGAWDFPGVWVKLVLMLVAGIGLAVSYGGSFGKDAMVSLLLVAFMLKLLELRRRRDMLVLCYLGYFVAATQFLFFSNILAGIYGLFSIAVVTATLLSAHQSLGQYRFWRTLKSTSLLLLQAFPLMLILFLVAPRIGPLWAVPQETNSASTGMSDSVAPGDIANLARSNALAFRVSFEGAAPAPRELYWRGLVLSDFDGRQWRQSQRQQMEQLVDWPGRPESAWRDQIRYLGGSTTYEIILEPSRRPWLFSLSAPAQWSEQIGLGPEFRLQKREPIFQRTKYQVTSYLDYRYQPTGLADWEWRQELQLPGESNPQTVEQARTWRREAASDQALIDRLLNHYRASFRYTLQPQTLGRHTVDEFLWQTQEGFCEHFASSFVFFLRAAGIPARVVVGYQGGELNPLENYWMVRQREAHAWAEVWQEGRGWVRYDPTAAVAPERIEQGLDDSLSTEQEYLEGEFGGDIALLNQLRLRWDLVNYRWSRWVLEYDQGLQSDLLSDWLGGTDPWRIALFVVLGGGFVMGLIVLVLLWRQRARYAHPGDRYYALFCRKLARQGLARHSGEAPRDYARRVSEHNPALADQVRRVTHCFELVNYAGNRAALADLRRAVREL